MRTRPNENDPAAYLDPTQRHELRVRLNVLRALAVAAALLGPAVWAAFRAADIVLPTSAVVVFTAFGALVAFGIAGPARHISRTLDDTADSFVRRLYDETAKATTVRYRGLDWEIVARDDDAGRLRIRRPQGAETELAARDLAAERGLI